MMPPVTYIYGPCGRDEKVYLWSVTLVLKTSHHCSATPNQLLDFQFCRISG
jgi:hypothetical protein